VPRRLLVALAEGRRELPGRALSKDELVEAGWPGERMSPEAADKRLRTAVWSLRKAGLEGLLLTRDDGYLLDPLVPLSQL
jgi:DNA-binding SARP family transcriptional activator